MPSFTNSERVLLFGKDRMLLDIRALVLKTALLAADVATDLDKLTRLITDAADTPYGAIICCYTTPATECEEIAAVAAQTRTPILRLTCLEQPASLIKQIKTMLHGQ